ncbi:lanthionine synthetase LanC family protein [Aquimarina sp. 2201CG1-2-11]|uniref:lanthionine synthetase LanC family protein n=1 Tax=Aquimarina discodermiae TaxID=3231043 RepID=UPI0034629013
MDRETSKNKEIGVLSDTSGVALFQFYYSKFLDDDIHADKGIETITKMVEYINSGFNYPTFCKGIAGAYWVLEILREEDFVELDEDFLSHSVDGHLLEAIRADIQEDNFDFLHGAMGYGFYKDTSLTSTFPNWIVSEAVDDFNSRLAWCYGDLGIGIFLLRVAETLKDEQLYKESLAILKKTTKRRDKEEASVVDAGLCHGACGILNIYNYLYKKTGDSLFKSAADFWAQETLQMATVKDGFAGYAAWHGSKEKWIPEVSLLEGVAGIGLTIISYLTSAEMKWDECLLIS